MAGYLCWQAAVKSKHWPTAVCRACLVPPEIVTDRSCAHVTAAEGDDVTLECHVTGSPAPTVMWYRKSVLVGNGEQLRVDNVSRYEADDYQCVADNGVGQAARCRATVTVECNAAFTPGHMLPDTSCIHLYRLVAVNLCQLYRQQNCLSPVCCWIQKDTSRPWHKWIVILCRRDTVNMNPEQATCIRQQLLVRDTCFRATCVLV